MNSTILISILRVLIILLQNIQAFSLGCVSTLNCPPNSICLAYYQEEEEDNPTCECRYGYYQDQNGDCIERIGSQCLQHLDCDPDITRGYCYNNEICRCQPGLILYSPLSLCIYKTTTIFGYCSVTEDCDQIPNTICSNNKCVCNEETHLLNLRRKLCQPLPDKMGDSCNFDDDCSQLNHTTCESYESQESWGSCKCVENYVQVGAMCKESCESHDECQEDQFCVDSEYCDEKKGLSESCSSSLECLDPNSVCEGDCVCSPQYKINFVNSTTVCVPRFCPDELECSATEYCYRGRGTCHSKVNLGNYCIESGECFGNHTFCNSTTCQCLANYKPNPESSSGDVCIQETCPGDFICTTEEYCDVSGQCQPKKILGSLCNETNECKGLNVICVEGNSTCECKEKYKESADGLFCVPEICPQDFLCRTEEFCDLNGACRPKKSFGSFCNATIECQGSNIVCADLMSNGIRSCNCPDNYLPDRPPNQPGLTCIEILHGKNCSAVDSYGREWLALPGEIKIQSCPGGRTGSVTWKCLDSGKFQGLQPNYNNCTTPWVTNLGKQLNDLMNENQTIVVKNASIFMSSMKDQFEKALIDDNDFASDQNTENQFFGHEIQTMIEMINTIITNVTVPDDEELNTTITAYEGITQETITVTNLLLTFVKPWDQLTKTNRTKSFTSILNLINRGGFQLSTRVSSVNLTDEDYLISHDTKSFIVESGYSKPGNFRHFPSLSQRKKGKDSFIDLPPNWQNREREESSVSHVGMNMGKRAAKANIPAQIIQIDEQRVDLTKSINGDLLGFKGGNEDNTIIFQDGEYAYVTFKHDADAWGDTPKKVPRRLHKGEKPRAASGTTECVLFDDEHQLWSSSGCQMKETSTYSTTCSCSRSGFFGVATQFHEYVGKSLGLEIVTIFFPVMASVVEIKLIRRRSNPEDTLESNIKSIMIATFAINNLLLTGFVDRNLFDIGENWCYFVGLMAHFITLSSFTLFASLSIKTYFSIFLIKEPKLPTFFQDKKLLMYMIACFGISALIVIITVLVGVGSGAQSRVYGGDFCWLDGSYIWALFAPGVVAIIVNLILISFINRATAELFNSDVGNLTSNEQECRAMVHNSKKFIKKNLGFSILLGVTWIIGYYQLGPEYSDTPLLQYLFPLLFAIQGGYLYWFENDFHSIYDFIPDVCFKKGESNEDDKKNEKKHPDTDDEESESEAISNDTDKKGVPVSRIKILTGVNARRKIADESNKNVSSA